MKNIKKLLVAVLSFTALSVNAQLLSNGVSKELADQRKANISNVIYDLTFNIPANLQEKVTGKNIITFDLKEDQDVILDFQGGFDGTVYYYTGKKGKKTKRKMATATYQNEHIVISARILEPGTNKIELDFTSNDKALNRHQDYMYTLFVPDHARSVYPCFDQPDLRARYLTDIKAPDGWKTMTSDGCCPLPTYLYSFVAGNFQEKTGTRDGRPMRALYRETDPEKVAQLDQVFDEAAAALKWMEGYTGIANPFGKEFGLVILPGYQFGGMEHPGAIHLRDRRIFLDKFATQEEQLSRTELIAHETAHLWFGDLVSPKWFEDVWTKEVLASFMAAKITRRQYNKVDHDLNFIRTYQTRAIAIDRTEGTHPIAQKLENLNHASLLYDNIIYDKAPVMMRMLEQMVGAPTMQTGLQKFLVEHSYGNASWDELIETLAQQAPSVEVRKFSDVWVKEKGMPNIHVAYRNGQVIVTQTDPWGRGIFWPQKFDIQLIYELGTSRVLHVNMDKPQVTFSAPKTPDYIIPNYSGMGYGRFTLDEAFTRKLPMRLITTRSDLARYNLLCTIHENYLMGRVTPSHFGEIFRAMSKEKNPLIITTAVHQMFKIASDMTLAQRKTLELCLMDMINDNRSKECRQAVIRTLGAFAISPAVLDKIYKIWNDHNDQLFSEYDYMEMAYHLAIVRPNQKDEILSKQRARLTTDDMRSEFDYVSRACNADADARLQLFNQLLKPENRQHEPWAIHALLLLNSEVYEPQSNAYIEPSLKSLPYIQQTSDIFFPSNWMKALFACHKSDEAKQIFSNFMKTDTSLSDNLKGKALDAAWLLMNQVPYEETMKASVVTTKPKVNKAKK
jgi:aminopeptidase N